MKKLLNWIKNLLKRTKFDNMLFEKGIKEVEKYLLQRGTDAFENVDKIYDIIVKELLDKFGHIKCVYNVLDKALSEIHNKLENSTEFLRAVYVDKVKVIMAQIIEWYNKNL